MRSAQLSTLAPGTTLGHCAFFSQCFTNGKRSTAESVLRRTSISLSLTIYLSTSSLRAASLNTAVLASTVLLATTLLVAIFAASPSLADEKKCADAYKDVELVRTLATASTWANLRGSAGSLKSESKRLLNDAFTRAANTQAPADSCPADCTAKTHPQVIFETKPNKTLSNYSDRAACLQRLATTTRTPIQYLNRRFATLDELSAWFADFSQGSGDDGADLYSKCEGSCSPQYRCEIERDGSAYKLNAHVICGEARDKDDNQFVLTSTYRWVCN